MSISCGEGTGTTEGGDGGSEDDTDDLSTGAIALTVILSTFAFIFLVCFVGLFLFVVGKWVYTKATGRRETGLPDSDSEDL